MPIRPTGKPSGRSGTIGGIHGPATNRTIKRVEKAAGDERHLSAKDKTLRPSFPEPDLVKCRSRSVEKSPYSCGLPIPRQFPLFLPSPIGWAGFSGPGPRFLKLPGFCIAPCASWAPSTSGRSTTNLWFLPPLVGTFSSPSLSEAHWSVPRRASSPTFSACNPPALSPQEIGGKGTDSLDISHLSDEVWEIFSQEVIDRSVLVSKPVWMIIPCSFDFMGDQCSVYLLSV